VRWRLAGADLQEPRVPAQMLLTAAIEEYSGSSSLFSSSEKSRVCEGACGAAWPDHRTGTADDQGARENDLGLRRNGIVNGC
jgi:hypothetical protein